MSVAGISWKPTEHFRDKLHKAKGDHLDWVHPDQKVLEMIRQGRLVLVIGGQEPQTKLKEPSGSSSLEQMVLMMARREAGLP